MGDSIKERGDAAIAWFNAKYPHRVWPHGNWVPAKKDYQITDRNKHMKACYRWFDQHMPKSHTVRWDVIGWTIGFADSNDALRFKLALGGISNEIETHSD